MKALPELLEQLFKAASLSRWSDFPKPCALSELDRQAHRAMLCYFFARHEKDTNPEFIVSSLVAKLLSRTVTTDIRPNVMEQILKEKSSQFYGFIAKELENKTSSFGFDGFIDEYFIKAYDPSDLNRLVVRCAGHLASRFEFELIYQSARFLKGIHELKLALEKELFLYKNLLLPQEFLCGSLAAFADLSGRLRFQKRWALTPRVPETSVLGHSLVVAFLMFIYCKRQGIKGEELFLNFYAALFHDLPEALTRDIISPVKYGVPGLEELLGVYEHKLVKEQILPCYSPSFLSKSEQEVAQIELYSLILPPKNSSLHLVALKKCDKLAALLEAVISIYHGISSRDLLRAKDEMLSQLEAGKDDFFAPLARLSHDYFLGN